VQVWRPGVDVIAEDEELSYDPTAYDCLHKFSLEWPCLSFDFVKDDLGGPRSTFPHTVFMVAGTQVCIVCVGGGGARTRCVCSVSGCVCV
jgi:ribosome assembly protein RRB1